MDCDWSLLDGVLPSAHLGADDIAATPGRKANLAVTCAPHALHSSSKERSMTLIQFTRNHTDHSTDKGYQFEFFCDRCGNGFMSEFQASAVGLAASALRAAGGFFGGILGSASSNAYEIERVIQGPAHDSAFRS